MSLYCYYYRFFIFYNDTTFEDLYGEDHSLSLINATAPGLLLITRLSTTNHFIDPGYMRPGDIMIKLTGGLLISKPQKKYEASC